MLGNGATLRKKEYLRRIGVTHILNAAEFRGVNLGKDYFDGEFHYMGVRIEDTPQTQICRYISNGERVTRIWQVIQMFTPRVTTPTVTFWLQ